MEVTFDKVNKGGAGYSEQKVAVWEAGMALFRKGCAESEVVQQLWEKFEIVYPLSDRQYQSIRTDSRGRVAAMKDNKRGVLQNIKRLVYLPNEVYEAWKNAELGLDGPKIKTTDILRLEKAMKGYCKSSPSEEYRLLFKELADAF